VSGYTVTVVGATGKTGWRVAALAEAEGWRTRRATRRSSDAADRLDWDDPASWATAFGGSDAAYVLIPFNHPGAPERTPDLLAAAAAAGVGRIVLLSTLDAEHAAPENPSVVAEEALKTLPVRWAVLRPTWFLDNFTTGTFAAMTAAGDLRLPAGAGRIPFVDARDIAAVAVAALAPRRRRRRTADHRSGEHRPTVRSRPPWPKRPAATYGTRPCRWPSSWS
jgi:uncharacterized protein YbjT (DUF2867 family)